MTLSNYIVYNRDRDLKGLYYKWNPWQHKDTVEDISDPVAAVHVAMNLLRYKYGRYYVCDHVQQCSANHENCTVSVLDCTTGYTTFYKIEQQQDG